MASLCGFVLTFGGCKDRLFKMLDEKPVGKPVTEQVYTEAPPVKKAMSKEDVQKLLDEDKKTQIETAIAVKGKSKPTLDMEDPAVKEAQEHFHNCKVWKAYYLDKIVAVMASGQSLLEAELPLQPGEKTCQDFSRETLAIAQATPAARHGKHFYERDLARYFYETNAKLFHEDPAFSPDMMEDADKDNKVWLESVQKALEASGDADEDEDKPKRRRRRRRSATAAPTAPAP